LRLELSGCCFEQSNGFKKKKKMCKKWETKTCSTNKKKINCNINLRHAVGCNFLPFEVETVGQGVVVVLVEDEESHSNGTTVGICGVIEQKCVVVVIRRRNRPIKRQKNQLS
jgi:hypothetical protein